MSVYEFLSVDIDTNLDAKTSISGGKDPYFGSSYQISTFFDVNIEKKRRYRRFCDDDIERKRRYWDNIVDIGYDIIYNIKI
jgi:hypothetical protein